MGALHTMFGSFTLVSETAKDACTDVRSAVKRVTERLTYVNGFKRTESAISFMEEEECTLFDEGTLVRIIAACRRLTNEGDLQHMCLITECTIGKKVQTVEVSWNTTTSRGIVPELTNQKGGWYTHTVDDNCVPLRGLTGAPLIVSANGLMEALREFGELNNWVYNVANKNCDRGSSYVWDGFVRQNALGQKGVIIDAHPLRDECQNVIHKGCKHLRLLATEALATFLGKRKTPDGEKVLKPDEHEKTAKRAKPTPDSEEVVLKPDEDEKPAVFAMGKTLEKPKARSRTQTKRRSQRVANAGKPQRKTRRR